MIALSSNLSLLNTQFITDGLLFAFTTMVP